MTFDNSSVGDFRRQSYIFLDEECHCVPIVGLILPLGTWRAVYEPIRATCISCSLYRVKLTQDDASFSSEDVVSLAKLFVQL